MREPARKEEVPREAVLTLGPVEKAVPLEGCITVEGCPPGRIITVEGAVPLEGCITLEGAVRLEG